jgi:biopolymer transport protein TolR
MTPTRVKRHRMRKHTTEGHLALIPFIDMLTIMVVFLLLHTADVDILPNTKNIQIPQSVSDVKPHETVVVMLTKDSVFVDGRLVASVADLSASNSPVIESLKVALMSQSDRILKTTAANEIARREVTIMGDRSVPYSVLKKVMATCTTADFGKVSLAVLEKGRVVGA